MPEYPDYSFVDMHCHMMPEVDDGSQNMFMSLNMMHMALDNGIGTIILTPHHKGGHHNVRPSQQTEIIQEMAYCAQEDGLSAQPGPVPARRSAEWRMRTGRMVAISGRGCGIVGSRRIGPELVLYPGNEIMYDSGVPERLEKGSIRTMADTSYVLVEFRPEDPWPRLQEGIRTIAYEGYRVILAHCERYRCLLEDTNRVRDLRRNQVCLQVNAESVLPQGAARMFGSRFHPVTRFVHELLEDEMVSFVSTDAHRDRGERAPYMLDCWQYLMQHCDPEYVREITRENALCVIQDRELT